MRKKGSYRIKDIAIMSGVSTGTVDRIIHNRGKVSEEARVKVEEVLKKVDYRPNIVASALASKKTYKFVMLPKETTGKLLIRELSEQKRSFLVITLRLKEYFSINMIKIVLTNKWRYLKVWNFTVS
jgi:DNA-binding LacI/PurR family transcriptional regulator